MMHYTIQRWSDFARGVTPEPVTARMQQHLLSGCERCNRAATIMRKLALVAGQPEISVPGAVIHKAKAIFSIPRKPSVLSSVVAKVVFDSFLEPLPAGVRSRSRMFRQAMFEAGDVLIDVRLENQADGTLLVTGQVADRSFTAPSSGRIALYLLSDGQRRAIQANRFGEFQTVYHAERNVRLEINGNGRSIEVPLSQLSRGAQNEVDSSALDFVLPG